MEVGADRFVFAAHHPAFGSSRPVDPVADVLEEIEVADRSGVHAFGIGEHHSKEFLDSAPAMLLAAAAARTSRIRLSSAVTVLGADDPVRVFQAFATLDLISGGRAEIVVGRGSSADPFALFGQNMTEYDSLFAEKLDLLLRLNASTHVHWEGRHRARLDGQGVYPRPVQPKLPVWLGATGSPESFIRAGSLGLPLALGVIGGTWTRLGPLTALYREAGRRAGLPAESLKVGVHAVGFVGSSDRRAMDAFYGPYEAVFGLIGRNAGWPAITPARFAVMASEDGALIVGGPDTVAEKLRHIDRVLGGVDRVSLQMSVGPVDRHARLEALDLLGRDVGGRLAQV